MANENIKLCTEKIIPRGQSGVELSLVRDRIWENGSSLRVHFFEGDPYVQDKVRQYARVWEEFANITFDFVNDPNAEIRVSFVLDGSSWSAVGKDALNVDWFPKGQPTMNYGWLTPDSDETEFSRVIVHEFGHALGCIHEHSSPNANIPWDKPVVYAYYAARGWSKATVDHNLFQRYTHATNNSTNFDDQSIMLYAIPNELTIGDYEVGWNTELSQTDKEFIGETYPK